MGILLSFILFMMILSIILLLVGVMQSKRSRAMSRFNELFPKEKDALLSLEEEELGRPFFDRALRPLISKVAARFGGRFGGVNKLEMMITRAGSPGGLSPEEFIAIQFIGAVFLSLLLFVVAILLPLGPIFLFIFPLCGVGFGYVLPKFWLGRKVKERKSLIQRSLPDVLDLLCISVEAGLGFDLALAKVVEKFKGPLSSEFKRALQEMAMGRPRWEALKDVGKRCDVEDLRIFVNEVVQAEQLGVSMSNLLRIHSDGMRVKRRLRAEEIAHKAPIKILFPMVFFIFPTIFIVVLGPIVLKLIEEFGGR
jgi:tight adherence protein C